MAQIQNIYAPQTEEQLKKVLADLEKIQNQTIEMSKTSLSIFGKKTASKPKDLNDAIASIEKLNKKIAEQEKLIKKLNSAQNTTTKTAKQMEAQSLKQSRARQSLNNQRTKAITQLARESGEWFKLTQALKKAELEYRNIKANVKSSTSEIQRSQNAVLGLRKRVDEIQQPIKRFGDNVGKYPNKFKLAGISLRSFLGAFGLTSGIFMFAQAMRGAFKAVRDFEKGNATLAGVLQLSKEQTKDLQENAMRLGETTVKTATEIIGLQIAYARLSFNQKEIIDLTEATIDGSIAMNSTLDSTANLVGAIVNTFDDLSTTDAPKIIDILSLSTAKSALNFSKLETGIPIVAGAANAAGIPFTRLVALMGKLADSGIDVSTSSTALRNIFIESAAQGLDYKDILEKIKGSQDKLTAANDEFGKRAAVSSAVLAKNIDATNDLNIALIAASGTSKSMAEKELNTLDGAIKLLNSAWEGYILRLNESSDAGVGLKKGLEFIAKNLSEIINTLLSAVKLWGIYRLSIIATRLHTSLLTKQVALSRLAIAGQTKGVSRATLVWKSFNKALKANALFLAIGAIMGLASILDSLNKSITSTVDELHEANEEFLKQTETTLQLNDNLSEMADRHDELKSKSELSKEEQKELDDIIKLIAKHVPEAVTEIDEYGNALEINTGKVKDFNKENGKLAELKATKNISDLKNALETLEQEQSVLNDALGKGNERYIKGFGIIKKVGTELFKVETIISKTGKARIAETKLTISQEIALRKHQKAVKESINLAKEDIEANEDIVASITGVKNARQLENEESKRRAEQAEKEVLYVKQLRIDIKILKDKLKALTKDGYENLNKAQIISIKETRKSIKSKQDELNEILGLTKASKKRKKEIKETKELVADSVKGMQAQLAELTKLRDETKFGSVAWRLYDTLVKGLTLKLDALTGSTKKTKEALKETTAQFPDLQKNMDSAIEKTEALRKATDDFIKGISATALGDLGLGSLNQFFDGTFKTLFDNATSLEEQFAITFNAIADVATEAFSIINAASQASFDKQFSDLERQKEVSLRFTGDSAEVREEIEARYEEKRAAIQRKQAEAEKKQALFSIAVNTAKGVISALAIPDVLLAAAIGAIGIAKAAIVSGTQIPEFKDGVENFRGGLAIVGDGGKHEYIKSNGKYTKTPNTDTLVNLPTGSSVLKDDNALMKDLYKELSLNGIMPYNASLMSSSLPSVNEKGISKSDLKEVFSGEIKKLNNTIRNKKETTINLDERLFLKTVYDKGVKKTILNAKITGDGLSV